MFKNFHSRDDEQWLRHRQPLNNYLLRDTQWFEKLIHETCEQFVSSTGAAKQPVDNLEDEIYLWATNCNLFDHMRRRHTRLRVEFISLSLLLSHSHSSPPNVLSSDIGSHGWIFELHSTAAARCDASSRCFTICADISRDNEGDSKAQQHSTANC